MICKECGNEILPGTLFCTNCGAKAEAPAQEADSDKTVVLWDEEPQQSKQDDDKTVVLWDEEPQQSKQDDDRTVVLWDEEPQQPPQNSGIAKCCPNCGSNNAGDALFCVECGALMTETKPQPPTPPVAPPPIMQPTMTPPQMEQPPMQQEKPKKEKAPKPPKAPKQEGEAKTSKKLPIIIGAAVAAVVVIIGAIFVISGLSSKSVGNDLLYFKDNEVYMAKGGSFKPELITDSYFDDYDDDYYPDTYSARTPIQYTDDGKYMFYKQDIDGGEFDLYYKKAGSKEEGTKLESGVSSFKAYSKDMILYEKSDKLYLASLKDKEKIASDINGYNLSGDKNYVCWYEADGDKNTRFIQDVKLKKDKVKIKDVSYIIYSSDDLKEIYYMSDDTLYLMKNLEDKVKISSDVAQAYMLGEGDNKTLHYFKLEDERPYTYADLVKNDVDEGSEYSEYAEYVLDDLEYYEANISEYKVYSYSASADKSEEVTSFTGRIVESIWNNDYTENTLLYCNVDVEAIDKLKLSDIIDDYYYNYSDISMDEAFEYNLLEQAGFWLMTDGNLISVSGMEEFYEKPGKVEPYTFRTNSETEEIYMAVHYYDEKDGSTYDLYVIPYTDKEVECRLITNELYSGNLIGAEQGIYYLCDVDKDGEEGILFLNGVEVAQDVYPSYLETTEDAIYYIKDINSDHDEGTLYMNKNGKETEIAEDVASGYYEIIKDGNIAYFVDYSYKKNKGDLFVFTGRKSIAVDTDVTAILQ